MPTTPGDSSSRPFYFPGVHSLYDTANLLPLHVANQHQNSVSQQRPNSRQDLELNDVPSSSQSGQRRHLPRIRTDDLGTSSVLASDDPDLNSPTSDIQMSRRKSKSPNPIRPASSRDDSIDSTRSNGHATGAMENLLEHRRKHAAADDNSPQSQVATYMNTTTFSLDEDPAVGVAQDHGASKGFSELPKKDQRNFLLLVLLYFLQGIPTGLASGSVPFLLKSHLSYSQIGVFSLASYPYSLKLLWSPIVDAIWSPKVGRRKSWILPIQTLSGFGMLWLGSRAERMMEQAGADGGAGIWAFTWWWFFLVFMCSTQDIAVDGKPQLWLYSAPR